MKRALIIIDMQKASFDQVGRWEADKVVHRQNLLSSAFRSRGFPVIFIQHNGLPEDGHLKGTTGWEILDDLNRDAQDLVIEKTTCDSFYQTDLKKQLVKKQVHMVYLTGCATDFCVDTTLSSSLSHGFSVTAVSDAHTTADRPHLSADQVRAHHNWVWADLIVTGKQRIHVASSDDVLSDINR